MNDDTAAATAHPRASRHCCRAFTVIELLVLIGIVVILLSIFIPYLLKVRESSRRVACAQNLYVLLSGLQAYARDSHQTFPRVAYDERGPEGYVAFTGAADDDPFVGGGVRPNDVTASLWLLVRQGYVVDTGAFVCPSSGGAAERVPAGDEARLAHARTRGNFSGPRNLTYSYASPFSGASGYRLSPDILSSEFALMADQNPGDEGKGDDVTAPPPDAPPLALSRGNSNNHDGAGQNVLYAAGYVEFKTTPYAGADGDNIYTARARSSLAATAPAMNDQGFFGVNLLPASVGDSFLVPSDDQTLASFPATRPATAPATTQSAAPQSAAATPAPTTTTAPATAPVEAPTTSPSPAPTTTPANIPAAAPAATAPAPAPAPATQPASTQPAATTHATAQ